MIRTKKQKIIMGWILVWAGLFIVVLYSPVGSPGLYTSQNYYVVNQSVTFKDGAIPNAFKIKSSPEYNDDAPVLPDISESLHSNYASGGYSSASVSSPQGSSYEGGQAQSYQNNNSSGGVAGGGSFIVSRRSGGSAASSGFSMSSGISTMSVTSNLNSTTSKQNITSSTTDTGGGTDPGGDPDGNPIPVGDSWGFLVLLGLCYAAYKTGLHTKNQINPLSGKSE